jgi:hypothetical protein
VAFAQFEKDLIRERQRDGIAIAKQEGKYSGRKASLTPARASGPELPTRQEKRSHWPATLFSTRATSTGSVTVSAEQRIIDCPSTVSDKQAISEPACLEAPQILLQSR